MKTPNKEVRNHGILPRLSVWQLIPVLLVLFGISFAFRNVSETDVYWHLRMGQDILSEWRFTGDPYWVFGPGDESWVTTQWLAEVVLYAAYAASGWMGIVLLRVILALALFLSVFLAVRHILPNALGPGRRAKVTSIIGLLVLAASPFLVMERPQTLTFVILPWLGVLLLSLLLQGKWPAWWILGPLVILWSWFHGGALIVAPALIGTFALRCLVLRRWPSWGEMKNGLPVVLISALAPTASPIGILYYKQAFLIQEASQGTILEWLPARTTEVFFLVWASLLICWVYGALRSRSSESARLSRVLMLEGAFLVTLFAGSTLALRYIPVVFLLSIPLVARRLSIAMLRTQAPREIVPRSWGAAVISLASILTIATVLPALPHIEPVAEGSPTRIWSGLAATTGERAVIVDYNISGATQVFTREGVSVSIDGRSDRYGHQIAEHSLMTRGENGWDEILARDYAEATDVVVSQDSALVEHLTRSGWSLACIDGGYAWLVAQGVDGSCGPSDTPIASVLSSARSA